MLDQITFADTLIKHVAQLFLYHVDTNDGYGAVELLEVFDSLGVSTNARRSTSAKRATSDWHAQYLIGVELIEACEFFREVGNLWVLVHACLEKELWRQRCWSAKTNREWTPRWRL